MSRQAKDFTKGKSDKRNFKKGSGKRFPKNGKPNDEEIRDRDAKSMNDITWYAMSEQLLRDTSSFPYAWSTGLKMSQARPNVYTDNYVIPGIITADVTLSPLTLNNPADPINVAARQIVGYIRSFNSGAKNYDPNDLMIRILAEGNFLAFLNFAIRIYATINMYSSYNKYMPRDLLTIQGVDPDDLRANMANYRAALNTVISKAASVVYVPANLHLFKRWAWLFSNYYADSNNPKDQIYLLRPTGFSHFEIDEDTSMGKLTYIPWATEDGHLHPWTDIILALNTMLDPLVEDQELCIMTGDMMKAYGGSAIAFQLVPDSLTAIPAHDPLVLQQFKSARSMPYLTNDTTGNWRDIVQDANGTYLTRGGIPLVSNKHACEFYDNSASATVNAEDDNWHGVEEYRILYADAVLDSPNPAPTAVDNMENTRLITMPLSEWLNTSTDFSIVQWTAGSEVVERFSIGYREYNSGENKYNFIVRPFRTVVNAVTLTDGTDYIPAGADDPYYIVDTDYQNLISDLTTFDYAPCVYAVHSHVYYSELSNKWFVATVANAHKPIMRISNFALLPSTTLEKMNNCALLSMVNIAGFQPK